MSVMALMEQVKRMRQFQGTITDWYMHHQALRRMPERPELRVELHPTTEAALAGFRHGTVITVYIHRRKILVRLNGNRETMHVTPQQIRLVD